MREFSCLLWDYFRLQAADLYGIASRTYAAESYGNLQHVILCAINKRWHINPN
jgi:hypothetical protein